MNTHEALAKIEDAPREYRQAAENAGYSTEDISSDIDDALFNAGINLRTME